MLGVDDDVDQGEAHEDAILTTLSSEDSWFECDEARRTNCNRAARYGNFSRDVGVAPMDVTVADDDTAGVVVSHTSLDALYDNYGDALSPAIYHLNLTSKPTAPVTVSLSGWTSAEGGYEPTRVSPATVTFTPATWADGRRVVVRARAPIEQRPVCSSGNRFCNAIESRSEIVVHTATSVDSMYEGISVENVAVGVSVVHDASDPPKILSARFSNLLNSLIVTFDRPTDRLERAGAFSCTAAFDLAAVEVASLFGRGDSLCTFTSDSVLKVVFGQGATVVPGTTVALLGHALKSSAAGASLRTVNESFFVGQPLVPTVPTVSLSPSSTAVGLCDDLVLDGSASSGSGGRAPIYGFTVASVSGHDVANITAALQATNVASGGRGMYKATVPSDAMNPGSVFSVTLTSTNFLGYSDSATVTVTKLGAPAPLVKVQGANPRMTIHSDALKLQASAELPTMTCVSQDLSSAKMGFSWFEDTGAFTGQLSGTSKNPRALEIPAGSLAAGVSYIFRVVGYMVDEMSLNNTGSVTVTIVPQDLVARIAGGAYQQIGRDTDFELDGSESEDPDESVLPFVYAWSCAEVSAGASCGALGNLGTGAVANVAANTLTVGTYTFSLVASTSDGRSSATSVTIEILAGAPPAISISALQAKKYNKDEGFTSVTASVSSTLDFTTVWSSVDSDVASPFLLAGQATASISNRHMAVVALSALTEGSSYTFMLTATDSDGQSSYSTVALIINEAPSSGSVEVNPASGFALDTGFEFTALNWVDEDMPFRGYIFGTADVSVVAGVVTVDAESFAPFGDLRGDASLSGVTLSAGSNFTNYTVGVFTQVIDSYGAVGWATSTVRVRAKPLTTGQLYNISTAKSAEAIDGGNADGSKMVLVATTDAMKDTAEDVAGGRRALLGASGGSELLATTLRGLWDTYAITTVTQADVASLLDVLVGIVETVNSNPDYVTKDVASGSLAFLTTILDASHGAGLALSTTAATNAGKVLAALFETDLFASDEPTSVASWANVTAVLGKTSAGMVLGAYDGVGYALTHGDVDMYTYRSLLSGLGSLGSLALSAGGSADSATAVSFDAAAAEITAKLGAAGVASSSALDLKVATLPSSLFDYTTGVFVGTAAAKASRLDQASTSGGLLLRSELTLVEVALQDSTAPLEQGLISGLASTIDITLAATVPFNTSVGAFERSFKCDNTGDVVDLNCPLEPMSHTCDLDTHGSGGKYFFTFACPMVVPVCLWWDESTASFSDEGCAVASGYSPTAVTCSCTHLTTFVLSGNTTEPSFEALSTPSPTLSPTELPTAQPTHPPSPLPTAQPSLRPSPAPSWRPSQAPTLLPSFAPTVEPTHAPTPRPSLPPSHAPTVSPSLWPTASPSLRPTTADTATVEVSFAVVATAAPTDADKCVSRSARSARQTHLDASVPCRPCHLPVLRLRQKTCPLTRQVVFAPPLVLLLCPLASPSHPSVLPSLCTPSLLV